MNLDQELIQNLTQPINHILFTLLGTLIGGWIGYRSTLSLHKSREKLLIKAYFNEYNIIIDNLKNWLPIGISEFKRPSNDEYVSPNANRTELIDQITIQLASTTKILNKTHRVYGETIKSIISSLEKDSEKRSLLINEFFKTAEKSLHPRIKIKTGQMLFKSAQIIYACNKLITEKENLKITSGKFIDYAEQSCTIAGIEFNPEFWNTLVEMINAHEIH